jgi:hypothetical protein
MPTILAPLLVYMHRSEYLGSSVWPYPSTYMDLVYPCFIWPDKMRIRPRPPKFHFIFTLLYIFYIHHPPRSDAESRASRKNPDKIFRPLEKCRAKKK